MMEHGDMLTTEQGFGKHMVMTSYKLDETVDFVHKGSSLALMLDLPIFCQSLVLRTLAS